MQHTKEKNKRIYLSSPHMGGLEMGYIQEAFRSNWVAPLGENVVQFEKEVAALLGRKYAVALSSGTAAIHLALKALGIKKGDTVLCPTLTFAASANPIAYEGGVPVFVDCDESLNICPIALEKALKKYPSAKAIICVDLYGNPCAYDKILPLAKKYGVPVLEDAAESLGAEFNGVKCGNFGEISILSFNGNKIITTSGGGMLLTDNKEWADYVLYLATQAREKTLHYEHKEIGYNYRLSNICAGIGRGQLRVLDARIKRKREIFSTYSKALKMMPIDSGSNCWLSVAFVDKPIKLIEKLESENIEARPLWKPMHMQPVFERCDFIDMGNSENFFKHGICLPSDTKLSDSDISRILRIIK